jgi:hypothetical protein
MTYGRAKPGTESWKESRENLLREKAQILVDPEYPRWIKAKLLRERDCRSYQVPYVRLLWKEKDTLKVTK